MADEEVNLKKKISLKERNWSEREVEQLITSYEASYYYNIDLI